MLNKDISTELLGLQYVEIGECKNNNNTFFINITTKPKHPNCCCGGTTTIHDYRVQPIKHLPLAVDFVTLLLKKRRYRCCCCKKIFYEKYDFIPRYKRLSKDLRAYILHKLRELVPYKSVAKLTNISTNTVTRVFDELNYSSCELPRVLGIDEFKSNTNYGKYSVILTDLHNKTTVDIVEPRTGGFLQKRLFYAQNRKNVDFVVIDMWRPYYEIAKTLLPNAKIIIDKFHYVRQVIWAVENVRKRIQSKLHKEKRLTFKHSKKLIQAHYSKLNVIQQEKLHNILDKDGELEKAWYLKELFYTIMECTDKEQARLQILEWFNEVKKT